MTLGPEYLAYPMRRYGMDHDRYDWSMLPRRKPVEWPGGARVALWLSIALEWFPLDMAGKPFRPAGGMVTRYPDLRHYTLRDYGNRVGIYRLLEALERRALRASVPVNAAVVQRYPSLVQRVVQHGHELVGHGLDMDHLHHGGMEAEAALIARSLGLIRQATSDPVRGWLSPARSQSAQTLDLLAAAGVEYVCDWCNDDMPFEMRTANGPIHALPHNPDIDDYTILVQNHHSEAEFTQQLIDQFDVLYAEAAQSGGRVMSISLRPWVIGQPYRMHALEAALDHMSSRAMVWSATGAEILAAWKGQQ